MPFEIVRNDIVNMQVDAVVNTANPAPIVGSGVDRAIHTGAGGALLEARKKIGAIGWGEAVMTPGFALPARYVIHTVGPVWMGGEQKEAEVLASCYRKSLDLAKKQGCKSIAFPLIATGNFGFPKALALQIAVREISAFLLKTEMQIYLVVFDKEAFSLSEKLFRSVNSYIDENYVSEKKKVNYEERRRNYSNLVREEAAFYAAPKMSMAAPSDKGIPKDSRDWGELLRDLDAGFSERLLQLIDRTGKKDSEIYKKANVDRKLFSKIKNNKDYKPSKTTALAFAIALELDLEETKELIGRAGFALSHSNKFDVIVECFLVSRNYDIFELNAVLFAFDQPLLGS